MGPSLAKGVNMLNTDCEAFMIFLGDMPDISKDVIHQLIVAFEAKESVSIVRPTYEGKPGHPVLFATSHMSELTKITDDRGASHIIKNNKTSTLSVEVSSLGVVRDMDRSDDLD